MIQLLGIIVILCCGQGVYSQDGRSVLANFTQARKECDTNGTVLPWTSADNTLVEKLQMTNKSATWIDLTISPSPWNWIADNGYAIRYDQGCYNLSSLCVQKGNNSCTNIYTCNKFCASYLFVGVQSNSSGHICCICTNEMEISLVVSEVECSGSCGNRQFCGNENLGTYRLLSTHELSLMTSTKEAPWKDNQDLNTSLSFLCASLLIHPPNHGQNTSISLVPEDCTTNLSALCESVNGTVKSIDQASWFGAQRLCHENGMKLVRVASKYQKNILLPNIKRGWTALRGWTWKSKGNETCDLVPTYWSSGYPKKSDGECITLAKDGSWRNVRCDANMPFLCVTSLNTSSPAECGSLNLSTSANVSYHTAMMEASTTSGQLVTTISDPHTTATSDPQATTTPEPYTTSKLLTSAKSETHRDTSSDPLTPTSSLTEVTHTTPPTDYFTTDGGYASKITSGLGVAGVAVGSVIAFLVLAAVVVIAIVFLRKRKQASSGGNSSHTQRDPGDDKSLRPECDQSMDELPIYARPNRDQLTDGVILVVENSLYGSVDLEADELPSSRHVAPAIANARGQGIAVYEMAMVSIGGKNSDDSTSGQEAGDLSGSDAPMKDQVPADDTLMIDNSLYDSTDSAMDGLPVS